MLVSSIIFSTIILTLLAVWYRQVILQTYLSEHLLQNSDVLMECRSLLPVLQDKVKRMSKKVLLQSESDFLVLKEKGKIRWKIDRKAWQYDGICFIFHLQESDREPIRLKIAYLRP